MTYFISEPIVLRADQDHAGVRGLVLLFMLIAFWLSFLLVSTIVQRAAPDSQYVGLLSCVGALPLALGAALIVEGGLKRVWPSGRHLTLDDSGIRVNYRSRAQRQFSWNGNLTQLKWFFRLKGYQRGGPERRMPKQWFCFACQLQQDENRLVVYSFFSSKDADALLKSNRPEWRFHQIHPGDLLERSFISRLGPPARPEIPANILAGKDGRFWLAERRRWQEGFELSSGDFKTFVQMVRTE